MDVDMTLVRDEDESVFDLAVGEPVFLQESLEFTRQVTDFKFNKTACRYPPFRGDSDLLKTLAKIYTSYNYFVVTNGAKQALLAALYAYKNVRGYEYAYFPTPHWPSYPTLVNAVGLSVGHTAAFSPAKNLHIITSPNNPDGMETVDKCQIWDAAYDHSVYGVTCAPEHEVAIWSAAKMFGLSGLRIGYLATNDEQLAHNAAIYVEKMSSGVCTESQLIFKIVLQKSLDLNAVEDYSRARNVLLENGKIFSKYLESHCKEVCGVPTSGKGMFAWFRVNDKEKFSKALKDANVRMIAGGACGGEDDWYRMSCGNNSGYTETALKGLNNALLR